jgi:hypothetical protein
VPTPWTSLDDLEDFNLGLRLVRMLVDSISHRMIDRRSMVAVVIEDIPGKQTITSILQEERVNEPPCEFRTRAGIKNLEE